MGRAKKSDKEFQTRMEKHQDELKWLYMELYQNEDMYAELCSRMYQYYTERKAALKKRDREREVHPDWYRRKDMLGMMLYIDNFAGNLKGVQKKLDYIKESNVSFIHLMPFLDTGKGKIRRRICGGRLPKSPPGSGNHGRSGKTCHEMP